MRQDLRQQRATDGRLHETPTLLDHSAFATHGVTQAHFHLRLQRYRTALVGPMSFRHVGEEHAFTDRANALASHVVEAENNVLRRDDDRITVRRREDVVRRHHQGAGFEL